MKIARLKVSFNIVPQSAQESDLSRDSRSTGLSLNFRMASATSSLGAAVAVERGASFLANLFAARIGGANMFGMYSLMVTTANSMAAYAGAGIGQTATRFSGMYSSGSAEYRRLIRLLVLFASFSISVAFAILVGAAVPIATYLMKNPHLASLIRMSSLSAGAALLMECFRGFLIGEKRYKVMLTSAAIFAVLILVGLPLAAHADAGHMLVVQSLALSLAAGCGMFLIWRGAFPAAQPINVSGSTPRLRSFAGFGLTQLLQTFCMNTSGLWVASMLARSDSSLVELGFFSLASQIRNMTALVPGLLCQSAFPLLTEEGGSEYGGSSIVLTRTTYYSVLLAFLSASVLMVGVHVALPLVYGKSFAAAETATILGIATAVVHMSASPAAARLSIVSLRYTGSITSLWAIVVAGFAWILSPNVDAGVAMGIYFIAHCVSAVSVAVALWRFHCLPMATAALTISYILASCVLALLGLWRLHLPAGNMAGNWAMVGVSLFLITLLVASGARFGWIPRRFSFGHLRAAFAAS